MTGAPPTPFLPICKHICEDQTLLIDTEPVFDDSFDSWPPSPRARVQPSELALLATSADPRGRYASATTEEGASPQPPAESWPKDAEGQPSSQFGAKRLGGDSPAKRHVRKRGWYTPGATHNESYFADSSVKPPTPVRNDFFTRRVQDSDRRSSLGPRRVTQAGPSHAPPRVVSRHSDRSSTSSDMVGVPGLSYLVDSAASLAARERCKSPGAISSQSHPGPIGHRSRDWTPIPHLSRHSPPGTLAPTTSLHRTLSNQSTASSSRRDSLSERVSGFFANLIRRRSSSFAGVQTIGQRTEDECGSAAADGEQVSEPETGESSFEPSGDASKRSTGGGSRGDEGDGTEAGVVRRVPPVSGLPQLRLPPNLTRPAPWALSTTTRALQPKKIIPNASSSAGASQTSNAPRKVPSTAHPIPPKSTLPPRSTQPTSSFTARALSRLPAPGQGSSSSSRPTTIRTTERALDLASKRETFERLAREAAEDKVRALAQYSTRVARPVTGMRRTVPVKGNTPGTASRQRAEERARFEQWLRERHEEKSRRDEAMRQAREELDKAEVRVARTETVVWAKGLPGMYGKPAEAGQG